MQLNESIKTHEIFDKYRKAKLKPEIDFINGIFELYSKAKSEECALIIDNCEKRKKLFSAFLEKILDLQIHVNTEEEIIAKIVCISYQFILFNVDSLFPKIDQIIEYIRADNSKNKDTPLYLITSNKSKFEQLKAKSFDDNIFVLEPFNPKYIELILSI